MSLAPVKGALHVKIGNELQKQYVETIAEQVLLQDGGALQSFINNTLPKLLSEAQKALLDKPVNAAGGLIVADAQGYLPNSLFNPDLYNALLTDYDKPDYAAMLAITEQTLGDKCMVADASGDPDNTLTGWGLYRWGEDSKWTLIFSKDTTGFNIDLSSKMDKVAGATAGNIATLDANGNIVDSGISISEVTMLDAVVVASINDIPTNLREGGVVFVANSAESAPEAGENGGA